MCKSMTGFGRSEFSINDNSYTIEVKSVNHRYMEVKSRLPQSFYSYELLLKDEFKKEFSRGSFSVNVNAVESHDEKIKVDMARAWAYIEAANTISEETGLANEVTVLDILKMKDVINHRKEEEDTKENFKALKKALVVAFKELNDLRDKEGLALKKDLLKRLKLIDATSKKVEKKVPQIVKKMRERLNQNLEKLLKDKVSEERIVTEAAIFSERINIDEEITRLNDHTHKMRDFLEMSEPIGRRLDFLCQEMGREANTMASKVTESASRHMCVEIKAEIEKIKEQVQNIE